MDRPAQIDIVVDGTVRVALAATVVMVRHDEVLSQVEQAMKAARGTRLQMDLTEVTALDSSGVALLVLARRLAVRSGAEFQVRGASPEIRQHLHMAGLTTLFGLPPAEAGDGPDTGAAEEVPGAAASAVHVLDEPFDRQGIQAIRDRLWSYATSCGLSGFDRYRLVLAASEIMTNAVLHGGGRGTIDVERQGERLVLRITDQGPGIPRQHRTGNLRPRPGRVRSAGLWLARQICERVDIDTGPGGTTVLLTYAMPPRAE
ncbi:anti-anti-sigma factor [Krasilnikovia cinnamomea]|uniref:Anti-anti-sigma factor n=1 Tax=Krasilnikovia cinnamomea TaxID=349313 RepID=A0A4Q7ZT38_9ACTN|nr:ATP-binding protein [Krasilnikovia cinnamomea]RZU53813.1 anti-anti-sigma factor [Krasilnikovia cinnamomea]